MNYTYPNQYVPMYPPQSGTTIPSLSQATSSTGNILTVFIDKEDEVSSYPVAAGTTVQLICFPANKFWLKSTSTNGVPNAVREFEFKETTKVNQIQGTAVTREEFDKLSAKIDKLINDLGGASNG